MCVYPGATPHKLRTSLSDPDTGPTAMHRRSLQRIDSTTPALACYHVGVTIRTHAVPGNIKTSIFLYNLNTASLRCFNFVSKSARYKGFVNDIQIVITFLKVLDEQMVSGEPSDRH